MPQIISYLNFDGNCREAMTFYKECLGGELVIDTVAGSPMADQMPDEAQQNVLHSMLNNNGIALMASDMMDSSKLTVGNSVNLMLSCDSEEQIRTYFAKLSDGGTVKMTLEDTFWGAIFGHFVDKFGIEWSLNYQKTSIK